MSRDDSEVSTLTNVLLDSVGIIQISGTPPKWQNVFVNNSQEGIIYLGAGISKEVDVYMRNTTVFQVCS